MTEESDDGGDARLAAVRVAVRQAARLAGRGDDVTLIAVSKTHAAGAIRPMLAAGHRDFGENRVQESLAKWPDLRADYPDVRLHLVGSLQSNKAEDAIGLFDAVHSLDRVSLVAALGRAQQRAGRGPRCFVQVNIGGEVQKGGCAVSDVAGLITAARHAELDVAGLMCVPPAGVEPAPYFALLAKIARQEGLPGLSMGMSDDYAKAVMIGATHVRVGTALFGTRSASKPPSGA